MAPRTASVLRALAAVEHALGRLAAEALAHPDVHDADRRRQLLDRLGVVDGEVRPAQQLGEVRARRPG